MKRLWPNSIKLFCWWFKTDIDEVPQYLDSVWLHWTCDLLFNNVYFSLLLTVSIRFTLSSNLISNNNVYWH